MIRPIKRRSERQREGGQRGAIRPRSHTVLEGAAEPGPATGPPPRFSVIGPGDPRTPSQQETEEFIHTRQRRTLKAIKSGILGLLAPGGGPRGKLPITRREKRGAGLEGGSHTEPRARLHVASSPSPPLAQAGTRVHVCAHACVPSAAASGSAHPSGSHSVHSHGGSQVAGHTPAALGSATGPG